MQIIKTMIDDYKSKSFEHQNTYGFELVFDELWESIGEIEIIINKNLQSST